MNYCTHSVSSCACRVVAYSCRQDELYILVGNASVNNLILEHKIDDWDHLMFVVRVAMCTALIPNAEQLVLRVNLDSSM